MDDTGADGAARDDMHDRVLRANQDFHDRFADHYETYYEHVVFFEANQRRIRGNLEDLRARAPGGVLLDVGCGTGNIGRLATGLFDTRYGVDISRVSLDRAEGHYAELIQGDVCDLSRFEDASVDAVTGYSLLHHLYDPRALFKECRRVLRPGGWVYFDNDPNAAYFVLALTSYLPESLKDRVEAWNRMRETTPANEVMDEMPDLYKIAEFHHHFGGRYEGFFPTTMRRWLEQAGFPRVDLRLFRIDRANDQVVQRPFGWLAQLSHSQMCVLAGGD